VCREKYRLGKECNSSPATSHVEKGIAITNWLKMMHDVRSMSFTNKESHVWALMTVYRTSPKYTALDGGDESGAYYLEGINNIGGFMLGTKRSVDTVCCRRMAFEKVAHI
jgi:hypothetical protein